ncbi:Alpha-protein kinase 1 [Beauveria bassiana]|nr:Alpha-protein kinase 1 [Beauveria bassiana]
MKPSGDPPASHTRASVVGTKGSKDDISKLADDLLRQSLTRKPDTSTEVGGGLASKAYSASPDSITRTPHSKAASSSKPDNPSKDSISKLADDLLRQSLTRKPDTSTEVGGGLASKAYSASPDSITRTPHSTTASSSKHDNLSKDSIRKVADDLLRKSLTRKPNASESMSKVPPAPISLVSITRTKESNAAGASNADKLLRASLVREIASTSRSVPPPYSSAYNSSAKIPAPSTLASTPSKIRDRGAICAAEADSKLREIKSKVAHANAALPSRRKPYLFKESCSTDLLFLIDTTYSMSNYIEAAKDQIRLIVKAVKDAFLHESEVRIAVVGYKDHNDYPNIEFLDFTSSVTDVHNFLSTLSASGGDDEPEDVLGGIKMAINASWKQATRCLVHIGDAPPHGHTLHDYDENEDYYYQTASEPHGLTYENLLERLVKLQVNYAFLRINSATDRMSLKFSQVYTKVSPSAGVKLHNSNAYHTAIADSLILARLRAKKISADTGPLFEEMQLGTTYEAIRHLVVSTVTSSISRTANRLSLAISHSRGRSSRASGGARGPKGLNLSAIAEDQSATVSGPRMSTVLEKAPPRWNTPGWLDQTISAEGFCLDLEVHNADTLNAMMDKDDNIKIGLVKLSIAARSKPFDEGAVRIARYAQPVSTTSKFVLKSFKSSEGSLVSMIEDMWMQALCKSFALEFNGLVKSSQPIDFVTTLCLQDKSRASEENLSLEPFIEGEYIKYNNNSGYVLDDDNNPLNEIAQAFSHFTFERSWGNFLVTDLQGSGNIFTDPAIQTLDPERFKLSPTNIGEDGFKFFFAMHVCKETCHKLGLLSNKEMIMSRKLSFRETWPVMDPTVCCSNKLCRKIIRLATAKTSPDHPGRNWCDGCFPQLKAHRKHVTCAAPGPKHQFEVSMFYCESQGEQCPTVCEEHLEKDTTVTPTVGSGLWDTAKRSDTKEISGRVW